MVVDPHACVVALLCLADGFCKRFRHRSLYLHPILVNILLRSIELLGQVIACPRGDVYHLLVDNINMSNLRPSPSKKTPFVSHWQELIHYRYLLQNLVVRDLKVRYKSSVLGVLWSLLNPLLMMCVFWLVFGVFANRQIRQYPVFVLTGLLPWNFFSASVVGGAYAILGNATLIKKVYFPRELLPVSLVLSNLVNFLIAYLVLIVALYASGLGLTRYALWLPIILLAQLLFTLGLVFFLSAAHLFFRDIAMILDVGMLALFFLTHLFFTL